MPTRANLETLLMFPTCKNWSRGSTELASSMNQVLRYFLAITYIKNVYYNGSLPFLNQLFSSLSRSMPWKSSWWCRMRKCRLIRYQKSGPNQCTILEMQDNRESVHKWGRYIYKVYIINYFRFIYAVVMNSHKTRELSSGYNIMRFAFLPRLLRPINFEFISIMPRYSSSEDSL